MSSAPPGTPWHVHAPFARQPQPRGFTFGGHALLSAVAAAALIVVFLLIPLLLYRFFVRGRLAAGVRRSFGRISTSRRRHHGGLDAAALASLPVTAYRRNGGANAADCAVCLSELADGDNVRALPGCGHVFHVECVDAWLASRTTCPVCRCDVARPSKDAAEAAPELLGAGGRLVITVEGGVAQETRTAALAPGQPAGRVGYRS